MIARWVAQMNQRERFLALGVGAILFLLVNLAIWSTLFGMSASARSQYAAQRTLRKEQMVYLEEEKTWKARADWLAKEQPALSNPAEASSLLTQVKEIASKHSVQIEDPQIGVELANRDCRVVEQPHEQPHLHEHQRDRERHARNRDQEANLVVK